MGNRRVVITGLGAVSGLGLTCQEFWLALKTGQSVIKPLVSPFSDINVTVAASVPHFNPDNYFSST